MLDILLYNVNYQLRILNGVLQIKIGAGQFVDTPLTKISIAYYLDGWISALLIDGTYRKMRVSDPTAIATNTAVPEIVADYQAASVTGVLIPGTAALSPPVAVTNIIRIATASELAEYSRENHPRGGRSFSIWAINGNSPAVPIGFTAGLTLTAISGTATVYQTSASLSDVQNSRATWEQWIPGSTSTLGSVHGVVHGATAVYVEALGGSAILGIRD